MGVSCPLGFLLSFRSDLGLYPRRNLWRGRGRDCVRIVSSFIRADFDELPDELLSRLQHRMTYRSGMKCSLRIRNTVSLITGDGHDQYSRVVVSPCICVLSVFG